MTWEESLEIMVSRTKHERLRWLCGDENPDANSREGYRNLMVRLATGEPAAPPQSSPMRKESPDRWLALIRACDDYNPGCCAHPAAFCSRFARNTTREQCIECLTADGITPPA